MRYLREYIEAGHETVGEPLSPQQIEAMDVLDEALSLPQLHWIHQLGAGEIAIINDSRMFHGRTTFSNASPPARQYDPASGNRLYTRVWVRDTD